MYLALAGASSLSLVAGQASDIYNFSGRSFDASHFFQDAANFYAFSDHLASRGSEIGLFGETKSESIVAAHESQTRCFTANVDYVRCFQHT